MTGRIIDALGIYRDRRMVLIAVLGFSSGLPLALSFATLTAWLASAGIDRTTIGLFALAGLPYAFKFAWAPAVDGIRVPWFSRRFGRRRGWMLFSQVLLAAAIVALGLSQPAVGIALTAALALLVAFLSATQDIVIDAFRVEILAEREQGAGAAAVQLGYRGGMLASGAGALYLADAYGWQAAYAAMGLAMGVGMVAVLIAREPGAAPGGADAPEAGTVTARPSAWVRDHVIAPFADIVARPGWGLILAFIVLYKFGDAVAGVMSNPFFIDIGFTLSEIASVTKVFGIAATLAGAVAGGVAVARLGVMAALMWCGALQLGSNLMFALQAAVGPDLALLAATIGIENVSGGMGTAAFVAYLSRLCRFDFTATQYALFSSLAAVGRTVLSSGGGWLAAELDWVLFFVASAALAAPGLMVLALIRRAAGDAVHD